MELKVREGGGGVIDSHFSEGMTRFSLATSVLVPTNI